MKIERLSINGLLLITPLRHGDARGYFSETFRADLFETVAGQHRFVQDNQSVSAEQGTVRGLHYQKAPHVQGKLVRVLAGVILDVAVDIRKGSPTFGQHVAVELSAENGQQLWVPPGFLHGFCTLTPDTAVFYKVTDYYHPQCDAAVRWNDPALQIAWPVEAGAATLSAKDRVAPLLAD
ncbi:MAG: dTDP-4-dehydrorhamnose 3,5-epimerase, partial [Proteobacteria bacterium]|nr:dTDP-4-dehydrorhamnose 3,5-epimerase [Pseudomonadota bacterium]